MSISYFIHYIPVQGRDISNQGRAITDGLGEARVNRGAAGDMIQANYHHLSLNGRPDSRAIKLVMNIVKRHQHQTSIDFRGPEQFDDGSSGDFSITITL